MAGRETVREMFMRDRLILIEDEYFDDSCEETVSIAFLSGCLHVVVLWFSQILGILGLQLRSIHSRRFLYEG